MYGNVSGGKMKHPWRFFCQCLIAFVITACEALGVPSQSTAPSVNQPITDTPASVPEQITFPQMTGTALAIPTVPFVIEPTQTPALPGPNDPVIISSNGIYAVACKDPFLILFNVQTNEIVSTYPYLSDCEQQVHWSPDSSYATFALGYDSIMRWRPDGNQPELLHLGLVDNPLFLGCNVRMLWSPDGHFLAIDACGIYVVQPFDESSLQNPLLVQKSYYYDFRWATSRLLMLEYHRSYGFYDVLDNGTAKSVGWWDRDGMGCLVQPPSISPDENWIVFDVSQYQCGISGPGENNIYQYSIVDLKQGSINIFSDTFGNLIDFIDWNKDSKAFYFISRPIDSNITADPSTPFGLLTINPQTLQIDSLFEQAQFAAFNKDFSWAYVVFPVGNDDGSLRFDGGLWQVGSTELKGRQVMFYGEPKEEQFPSSWAGSMYSASGVELGYSSQIRTHPIPAFWSHDNGRVALINAEHQLVVVSLSGDVQVIGKSAVPDNWVYPVLTWSDDDRFIAVDGVTWPVP